jgi:hypothetical protein
MGREPSTLPVCHLTQPYVFPAQDHHLAAFLRQKATGIVNPGRFTRSWLETRLGW